MNPRVDDRVWAESFAPTIGRREPGLVVVVQAACFLWLVELVEGDGVAERFELALEAAGAMFGRVALALPVRSELSVWDLVADDVVAGDQEVVADCADRLGLTAPSPELHSRPLSIRPNWTGSAKGAGDGMMAVGWAHSGAAAVIPRTSGALRFSVSSEYRQFLRRTVALNEVRSSAYALPELPLRAGEPRASAL